MSGVAKLEHLALQRDDRSWWNLQGIFFHPKSTFQNIDKHPVWILPFVFATLAKLCNLFIYYQPSRNPTKIILSYITEALPFAFTLLICSATFYLVLVLCDADTTFRKVFSVLAHTFYFYTILNIALGAIVFLVTSDINSIDRQNPVVSNLGFLVSKQEHLALQHLLASIDLIVIYHLYLIVLGTSIISRKITFRSATTVVVLVWAIYVSITVTIKYLVA